MRLIRSRHILLGAAAFLCGLIATAVLLRRPMEALTPERLAEARRQWHEADIHDYDLICETSQGTYGVTVRDDIVVGLTLNGHETDSAQPGLYSVPGLFRTLEMELDLPAMSPPGAQILERVRFHPQVGYLESYIRSGGPGSGLVIELTQFKHVP